MKIKLKRPGVVVSMSHMIIVGAGVKHILRTRSRSHLKLPTGNPDRQGMGFD